jgi:hypothetical protein
MYLRFKLIVLASIYLFALNQWVRADSKTLKISNTFSLKITDTGAIRFLNNKISTDGASVHLVNSHVADYSIVAVPNGYKDSGKFRQEKSKDHPAIEDLYSFENVYTREKDETLLVHTEVTNISNESRSPVAWELVFMLGEYQSKKWVDLSKEASCDLYLGGGSKKSFSLFKENVKPISDLRHADVKKKGVVYSIEPGKNCILAAHDYRLLNENWQGLRIFVKSRSDKGQKSLSPKQTLVVEFSIKAIKSDTNDLPADSHDTTPDKEDEKKPESQDASH